VYQEAQRLFLAGKIEAALALLDDDKLRLQPVEAVPSKNGSLIDLRKYAVSMCYLGLCATTEPAATSGGDGFSSTGVTGVSSGGGILKH